MNIFDQFNKNNTINNLSNYEVFYQISLGKYFALSNLKASNVEINFEEALGSIYEVLNDIKELNNAKEIFKTELQKQAAMDAMQYFVNENLEAIKNKTLHIDNIINQINDNEFFDITMTKLAEDNFLISKEKYLEVISDEISKQIIISLKALIK